MERDSTALPLAEGESLSTKKEAAGGWTVPLCAHGIGSPKWIQGLLITKKGHEVGRDRWALWRIEGANSGWIGSKYIV